MDRIRKEISYTCEQESCNSATAPGNVLGGAGAESCVSAALRRLEAEGCILRGRCALRSTPPTTPGRTELGGSKIMPVFDIIQSKLDFVAGFKFPRLYRTCSRHVLVPPPSEEYSLLTASGFFAAAVDLLDGNNICDMY
jgi:hypothetical protein